MNESFTQAQASQVSCLNTCPFSSIISIQPLVDATPFVHAPYPQNVEVRAVYHRDNA